MLKSENTFKQSELSKAVETELTTPQILEVRKILCFFVVAVITKANTEFRLQYRHYFGLPRIMDYLRFCD